ncbi:MAG: transposase [Clostridiaceae bacterium]|nr:transposase [Clostridiaceae bacterium]
MLARLRDYNAPFTNNLGERDLRPCKTREKISGCFQPHSSFIIPSGQ